MNVFKMRSLLVWFPMVYCLQQISDNYHVNSLSIATLFVKPSRVDIAVPQYFAYEMKNDDLLVGYGLPWQNKLRNVPYVSKLVNENEK